jgi:hypothetical protein
MAKTTPNKDQVVLPTKLVSGIQTVDVSTGRTKDSAFQDQTQFYANTSIQALRAETNPFKAVENLVQVSGDVSTSLSTFIRVANTELSYMVYDSQHQLSSEGALLLRSILTSMEFLNDYTYGFDDRQSMSGLCETLLGEIPKTGACALELVLDEARLPFRLQPTSVSLLKWKTGKTATGKSATKIIPWQQAQGQTIELDVPTFFYAAYDKSPLRAYSRPPLEVAIGTTVFQAETYEDIRRAVRRAGHSRLVVKLITEEIIKSCPPESRGDPNKLQSWMEEVRSTVESQLSKLNPESALVIFDTLEPDILRSEIGGAADYTSLVEIVDGLSSTALRVPPSVLGKRMGGSQNTTSTESLLFLKQAEGIRKPVVTVLSRAFTLAMRLYGFDGYVKVKFGDMDLRPSLELEAYKTLRQSRILELLSIGLYNDQEAAEELGTGMISTAAQPLGGTFFYKADASATAAAITGTNDPARQSGVPKTPQKAGGKSQ